MIAMNGKVNRAYRETGNISAEISALVDATLEKIRAKSLEFREQFMKGIFPLIFY